MDKIGLILVGAALGLWLAWALGLLFLMAIVKTSTPCYNGFRIIVPREFMRKLTPDEQIAVYMHEQGHKDKWHVWRNYVCVCFFGKVKEQTRQIQEFQADDYVIELGWGKHLASALYKTCIHKFDVYRANRIMRIVAFKEANDLILKSSKA